MTCKPLFHCEECGTDSRSTKYIKNHHCGQQQVRLKHRPRIITTPKSEGKIPKSILKKELTDTPSDERPRGVSAVNMERLKTQPVRRTGYGTGSSTLTKAKSLAAGKSLTSVKTQSNDTLDVPDIQIERGDNETTILRNRKSCEQMNYEIDVSSSKKVTRIKRPSQIKGETSSNQRNVSALFSCNRKRNRNFKETQELVNTTPTEFSSGTSEDEPSVSFNSLFTPIVIRSDEPQNQSELAHRISKQQSKGLPKNTSGRQTLMSHTSRMSTEDNRQEPFATVVEVYS